MKLKFKKILTAFAVFGTFALLNSCGEEAVLTTAEPMSGARVKFINAVSGGTAYTVSVNDKKWTAALVTAKYTDSIVLGSVFPTTDYTVVPAGSAKFSMRQPLSLNAAGTEVATGNFALEDNKYYLLVAADTLPAPKLYLVPDARFWPKDDSTTALRFINFLVGTPTAGYEFYLKRNATPFATLKYGESSNYAEFLPTSATGVDTVVTRVPGSSTIVHSFPLGATNKLTAYRTYAFLARGSVGGTTTKAPSLTWFVSN